MDLIRQNRHIVGSSPYCGMIPRRVMITVTIPIYNPMASMVSEVNIEGDRRQ